MPLDDVGAEIGEKQNLPPRHPENCREPKRLATRIPRRRSQHARDVAGQRREDRSARTGRPACGAPKDKAVTKSIAAILVVLGLASTAALPATGEAPPRRPNILLGGSEARLARALASGFPNDNCLRTGWEHPRQQS